MKLNGKHVLITGAASGIGRATAIRFAAEETHLSLCDIDEEGLRETAERVEAQGALGALVDTVDVGDRDQMRDFADRVHEERGAVDILVNNAGVGLVGGILETSLDDWDWVLDTNLRGVVHGVHFFVPRMVEAAERSPGEVRHVVNIASVAGLYGFKELGAYSTSKFGVVGLSEALRDEIGGRRVGVSAVCPGLVDTNIPEASRYRGPLTDSDDRQPLLDAFQRNAAPPSKVADAVIEAISEDRAVLPVNPEAWILYLAKRFLPDLTPRLLRWLERVTGSAFGD